MPCSSMSKRAAKLVCKRKREKGISKKEVNEKLGFKLHGNLVDIKTRLY